MLLADFFTTYKQIVIFDTEFTTWEGAMARGWSGAGEHRELVQIAAQKVDLVTGAVLSSFERIMRPTINPVLSDYFVALTGITQEQVKSKGISFGVAYADFDVWAGELKRFCYAREASSPADLAVIEENIALYKSSLSLDTTQYGTLTTFLIKLVLIPSGTQAVNFIPHLI